MFRKMVIAIGLLGSIGMTGAPAYAAAMQVCTHQVLCSYSYTDSTGRIWHCSVWQFSDCGTGTTCAS